MDLRKRYAHFSQVTMQSVCRQLQVRDIRVGIVQTLPVHIQIEGSEAYTVLLTIIELLDTAAIHQP